MSSWVGLRHVYSVHRSVGRRVGHIAVVSLVALACSSMLDLLIQTATLCRPLWQYVGLSNAMSLLTDTIVFTGIAFTMLPLDMRLHSVEGQYLAKPTMTPAVTPLVYGARGMTNTVARLAPAVAQ